MSRIAEKFRTLRAAGRKGFIPFITAGDPDLATSLDVAATLSDLGADVIELGVPFSDPMADGPTIQMSSQRALEKGTTLPAVLEMASDLRKRSDSAIVLFSYLNPLLSYGIDKLARDLPEAGVDGLLITDIVEPEASKIADSMAKCGVDLISLVAPTTSDERLEAIASRAKGFIYAVSRAGTTGARADMSNDAETLVMRVRSLTDIPVVVGFGISTLEHILDVWRYADAAVVGSAIVSRIAASDAGRETAAVEQFVLTILPEFAKTGTEI